ncbi:MAG: glycosyltransferase family 4 protein [Planctomycetales bacterium]|nr:glycosyltransferase family 4 protein [Planctomycetales bacterium]
MRIGLTIEHFDCRRGGVEHWTVQFARQLVGRGHQVDVVARSVAAADRADGVAFHLVEAEPSRLAFADAAAQQLASLRLDVVHDTGCGWFADVFQPHGGSRVAAFEQNLRLVPRALRPWKRFGAQVLPRYREFDELLARQYGDHRRLYVALSKMVARDLIEHHGVPASRIRTIYNGVDTQRFHPCHRASYRADTRASWEIGDEETVFLIIAHNFRLKGVATAVRSIARLAQAGLPVRLVVAGGGRSGHYRGLARRCGAERCVTFLGSVDDPAPLYAGADVYVQPTWYDPCSLVVLEALAAGLPVVTSCFNGAGELITPGQEGDVLDDPANDVAWAECLARYCHTRRREAMGDAARRLAERHDLERNCDEILSVYQEQAEVRRAA